MSPAQLKSRVAAVFEKLPPEFLASWRELDNGSKGAKKANLHAVITDRGESGDEFRQEIEEEKLNFYH